MAEAEPNETLIRFRAWKHEEFDAEYSMALATINANIVLRDDLRLSEPTWLTVAQICGTAALYWSPTYKRINGETEIGDGSYAWNLARGVG